MKTVYLYKMTHLGDPDPNRGVWGLDDCEGWQRGWAFDAVIGIGSPTAMLIANRVAWVGIEPEEIGRMKNARGPLIAFSHFRWDGKRAAPPAILAALPGRASRMYKLGSDSKLDREINELLDLAKEAPPSRGGVCKIPGVCR
jgi:hypothetical protein